MRYRRLIQVAPRGNRLCCWRFVNQLRTMSETQPSQSPVLETTVSWTLQGAPAAGGLLVSNKGVFALAGGAAQMLRLPEGDNLGLPLDCLPPQLLNLVRRELAAPGPRYERQTLEVSVEGHPTTLVEVTTLASAGQGGETSLLMLLRDAGFSTEMRRRLTHLDRLMTLGMLSANVAHELRNAFVAVKTFIDLLLEQNQDSELAGLVRRELGRIDELLIQALRIAEPAAPALQVVHVNDTVDKTLRLLEPRLRKDGITVHRELLASPDAMEGVENELQQVFMNLIMNAVEAMGNSGTLTVVSKREPGSGGQPIQVSVSIRDTGPGIAPEHQVRLFEPFFTTKPGGTGLGLAITQRIVGEHHGQIRMATGQQGTEFVVSFPVRS